MQPNAEITITWNTGRLYTAEGQVITAQLGEDRRVLFRDFSRAIWGALTEPTPDWVQSAESLRTWVNWEYLHNRYTTADGAWLAAAELVRTGDFA